MADSANDFSWQRLIQQAESLCGMSSNHISNAANLSALLYRELDDVSWAGFYFLSGETLMVGPFQGKSACVSIEMGEGVCGVAAASGLTIRVADVKEFDKHIVCDSDTHSEIVVPLFKLGRLFGVLDLDSSRLGRFSQEDEVGLIALAQVYMSSVV